MTMVCCEFDEGVLWFAMYLIANIDVAPPSLAQYRNSERSSVLLNILPVGVMQNFRIVTKENRPCLFITLQTI